MATSPRTLPDTTDASLAGPSTNAPNSAALDRVIQRQLVVMSDQLRLLGVAASLRPLAGSILSQSTTAPTARPLAPASVVAGRGAAIAAADRASGPPVTISDVVPFTEAQLEVWLGATMGPEASCIFNEVIATELHGSLDRSALVRALDQVVDRHEALRMTVSREPLGLRVTPRLSIPLDVVDVSHLGDAERDARIDALLRSGDTEPFDLANGPLLRMCLVRSGADRHLLVMTAHHLVCDGISAGVVLRDLGAFYSANVSQRPHSLEPPLQASEFARLTMAAAQTPEARATEAYWLARFKTLPDPLDLPTDRPRPAVRTSRGARVAVGLDERHYRLVKELASRHRTTVFVTLLALYQTLIYRLSGQTDFVVGIPIAIQASPDGREVVAHCLNFVPLRCTIAGSTSFRDHLANVQRDWFDVDEHQNFTYQTLLAKLPLRRELGRNPLVSVSFTSEPAIDDLAFAGLVPRQVDVPRNTAKRELHLNAIETADGLLMLADYNRDLFDEATMRQWIAAYGCLVESAHENPETPLAALAVINAADRKTLASWNQTATAYADRRLIHQLVELWARQTPDAIALVCEAHRLTWATLNQRANQLARMLVRQGVSRGDRVAICLARSADFVVALIAIHKAGAAYVPLDPDYPRERLGFLIRDAGAKVVVTNRSAAASLMSDGVTLVRLDLDARGIASEATDDLQLAVDERDLAYVMYTSGTTGQPKGVAVEHRNVRNYTWAVAEQLEQPPGSSYALVSTVAADLGNTSIFPSLATRGTLHVITSERATDGRQLGEYFERHVVDVLKITPTHLEALLKMNPSRSVLPRRCLVLGGEPAPPPWVAELQRLAPDCTIFNHYGPTETTVGAITFRLDRDAGLLKGNGLPLGKPLGNLTAYVLDAQGQLAPIGLAGELYIGGAGVARGYLNRAELTDERFVRDPFASGPNARMYRTGDRARWGLDGNLEFLGRADNQVKIRGFRVELGEVESALRTHSSVREAVVLLRHDDPAVPQLVAYVSGSEVDVTTLQLHAQHVLPRHAVPSAFVVIRDWPLTANGKLDRRALPAPSEHERVADRASHAAPSSPIERRLEGVWREVLGLSRIGMADDFFLLGGHSLAAMRLVGLVHREFGVSLQLSALFEFPIFGDLARHIEAQTAISGGGGDSRLPVVETTHAPGTAPSESGGLTTAPANCLVRIAEGGTGIPFFWVHGVGGEVFSYMALSRHLAVDRPVFGFTADWSQAFGHDLPTLEVMARHYVKVLRGAHPRGPYHIGGFCSAAMLALALAREIESTGDEVGLLAVIDYDNIPDNSPKGFKGLIAFLWNLPLWIRDDAMASGLWDFIGRVRSRLRRALTAFRYRGSGGKVVDFRDQLGMWRFPAHQVPMLRAHHHAIHSYKPKPFNGHLSLFLPRTHPLFGPWPTGDDRAWDELARGGVDLHHVRGSHSTMLTEPFVSELAQQLTICLAAAEGATAARPSLGSTETIS
jgi:amino acid adenylation domain-containing protein